MGSTQEGSSNATASSKKSEGKRRSWSLLEEQTLIAALKDLVVRGLKTDNGFKADYLNKLEEALQTQFPKTDLIAMPHITSKVSAWKKNYYSLSAMLNRSCVGFNNHGNHMIDWDDEQWEQIVKADPNARLMRKKTWPLFED